MSKVAVSSAMMRVMSLSGLTDGELVSAGVWYGRGGGSTGVRGYSEVGLSKGGVCAGDLLTV